MTQAADEELEYVGFWPRVGAALIDTVLLLVVCLPLLTAIYGADYWQVTDKLLHGPADFLINWVLPAIAIVLFWIYRQATPGTVAFDPRKQGWHDKLAGTLVVRPRRRP